VPRTTTAPRRWLSQAEAAEYLGVTDRTIRNYIARGVLKGHRVRTSRLVRLDLAELDALLRPIPTGGADDAA
jgi:excisionase family DNA binding protein